MGTFNTKKLIYGDPSLIPAIASRIEETFVADGYTVQSQILMSGSADISIAKGGVFKAVLGMRTALKITLKPENNAIFFNAGVGIFGRQIIPTLIMWYFAWPVLLAQIWGLVQQSKLDDKALAIAEQTVADSSLPESPSGASSQFCISCGHRLAHTANFCPHCGIKCN